MLMRGRLRSSSREKTAAGSPEVPFCLDEQACQHAGHCDARFWLALSKLYPCMWAANAGPCSVGGLKAKTANWAATMWSCY